MAQSGKRLAAPAAMTLRIQSADCAAAAGGVVWPARSPSIVSDSRSGTIFATAAAWTATAKAMAL